jgi:hypothetical protein
MNLYQFANENRHQLSKSSFFVKVGLNETDFLGILEIFERLYSKYFTIGILTTSRFQNWKVINRKQILWDILWGS